MQWLKRWQNTDQCMRSTMKGSSMKRTKRQTGRKRMQERERERWQLRDKSQSEQRTGLGQYSHHILLTLHHSTRAHMHATQTRTLSQTDRQTSDQSVSRCRCFKRKTEKRRVWRYVAVQKTKSDMPDIHCVQGHLTEWTKSLWAPSTFLTAVYILRKNSRPSI